ncbi:glycosyltransferase family 2 protein [Ferruginibacter yonginensis]|uniref:Glycosyltransferase family 2 protein n=1 Tax=Ferruginibacter yonginensis TaxID=1310416 RepID=A0ABV8QPR7_9BACT
MVDLSIVIVNFNTTNLLLNCLQSVYFFENLNFSFEVIVVDNNSIDAVEEKLIERFPSVKFIQMGYNAGFARANNQGIKIAKAECILLLNSDTIVLDNAIFKTWKEFKNSDFSAAGIQLLNDDYSPQISGNFAMKGGLNYLLPLPYLGKLFRAIAFVFKVKKPSILSVSGIKIVDWINGAFLMVKKDVVVKAGLLDEDFFLYAEEAEWCSRLKKIAPLCIYGDYHVLHLQGESSNKAFNSTGKGYFNIFDKKGFQIIISNFLRIRKQFGLFWFLFIYSVYLIEIPIFIFGFLITFYLKLYSFDDLKGYIKNMYKSIYFLPKIISNTPYFYKVL